MTTRSRIATQAQAGHTPPGRVVAHGRTRRTADAVSVAFRRLLSLEEAAQYLGLSFWSFRELVNAGDVPLVRVPHPRTLRQHRRGARSQVPELALSLTLVVGGGVAPDSLRRQVVGWVEEVREIVKAKLK